jgi:hypothetical protein
MNKIELEKAIEDKKEKIAAKEKEIDDFEIDVDEHEEEYCEALDEQGDVIIGGSHYSPSQVLREVDPTAYRCGLNDYVDSCEKDNDPKYQELTEELETLTDELADLESELGDIDDEE